MSIDMDATDDPVGRYRLRSADWWVKFIGIGGGLFLLATAVVIVHLWRTEASPSEWLSVLVDAAFGVFIVLVWLVVVARAWLWSRSSRAGRLVTCHACGHRWRLPR